MHESVLVYIASQVYKYGLAGLDTLELGALDINGSVRPLFAGRYVGIDPEDGPGVDQVMSAHEAGIKFGPASFDVVVCCEMLEHDPAPWLSMAAVRRVLRPGGHLLVTARGNRFPLHEHPHDYWRFMPSSFELLLDLAGCDVIDVSEDPQVPGVFGHGLRRAD